MSSGAGILPRRATSAQKRDLTRGLASLRPAVVPLVSAAVLTPCFWLPRIHAGDFSSHLYNAWLARLVGEGKIEGLAVTMPWTNVLFDLLLRGLMAIGGPRFAERVAVGAAVLIFFWGSFALARTLSRRHPWFLAPCLAGLAYGWTFHMGFFNFYLALGLSFWALALFWSRGYRSVFPYGLLAAAGLAHALPVLWAAALALYAAIARRLKPRRRWLLIALALTGMVGVRLAAERAFETGWLFQQAAGATGADQFWVYDRKYFPVFVAVLALWGLWFLRLGETRGKLRTVLGAPFQLWLLTASGILIIPTFVLLPGHSIGFQFIHERMSLAAGVLVCCMLAATRPSRFEITGMALTIGAFFAMLNRDAARWDRVETEMAGVVRTLPPGQRVVSQLCPPGSRVDPYRNMVNRACLGWCFSYANYEPSSGQFSLRVIGPNAVVAHERSIVWRLENGLHVVEARELPLHQVEWAGTGSSLRVRALAAGERAGRDCARAPRF